jgi:hypothetical protein
VLALKGPVHRGEVGFEPTPQFRRGLWLVFGLGVLLPGCLLSEIASFQLSPGFSGCVPPAACVGGPCLGAGVGGFELLAAGRQVAGERRRACGSGRVVLDVGVGGLLPGVGFGLGGEPQFPGHAGLGGAAFGCFLEQPAELDVGLLLGSDRGFQADRAPGERVGPGVHVDTERPARQLLYVTFGNPRQ